MPERHQEHPTEADSAGAPEEGERETFFVTRAGVGWTLEHGRMAFTPQTELDLVREDGRWDTAMVFGIAIGVGF